MLPYNSEGRLGKEYEKSRPTAEYQYPNTEFVKFSGFARSMLVREETYTILGKYLDDYWKLFLLFWFTIFFILMQ